MKIGKVIGTVVCNQKVDSLIGIKLLLIQPLNEALKEEGVEADIAALLLGEDGTYQFAKYEKDRLEQFLACLTIWRWQNEEKLAQMNFFKERKKGGEK